MEQKYGYTRMNVDATIGKAVMLKNIDKAYVFIEDMEKNHYQEERTITLLRKQLKRDAYMS